MGKKRKITFQPLVVERSGDGFLVRCPLIQGAFAEGDTIAEAIFNCLDVIGMIATYRKGRGKLLFDGMTEDFTFNKAVSFTVPVEV
ncbi:MAG: hypothetical protein N2381_06205 [Armatimonadetes bacterium]|nr:hypothetical protein [Armatimonadota bacterium]